MRPVALASLLASAGLLAESPAIAEELVVSVSGAENVPGNIACRLFAGPRNFPNGAATAGQQSVQRQRNGESCRFRNLAPGSYALVVAVLPPDQEDVTRDILGRPRQPWGVSNNVRPALRAPRYQEAAFTIVAGRVNRLTVNLAR
ncbi:DUF2141 domain-containing protein [Sphingomonas lacunae]|uniref:DUF2141 domain-containing protein n=1 Tax=Sphingomonas lacunae TaxID=2698828 RepID=A0A6M4AYL9_9SPHN|nr:DUF2141 domain-containing protein [Sphingomonas lacunae]QJQ33139.1 DUF2141 domain-containing protein [Sphingomonas lacunae]